MPTNAAIFLCAGTGQRMQGKVVDKILTPMAGMPVVCHSVQAFIQSNSVQQFNFVYRDAAQKHAIEQALEHCELDGRAICWTLGGAERQNSVSNALLDLSPLTDLVFIHDCARPLIHPDTLQQLLTAAKSDRAAVAAHRVTDTIKQIESPCQTARCVLKDVPRAGLWAMETPQVFDRVLITESYRHVRLDNISVTDDTAAVAHSGHSVTLVENAYPNPKLTTPYDLEFMEFLLAKRLNLKKGQP